MDFKEMRTVTAAVSTCHFDSVDIVTRNANQAGTVIALKGQFIKEASCTKSPSASGHWNLSNSRLCRTMRSA
ncbi:hypothetical protein DJ490_04225 [Enterobacter hormaechei]|nr:hypothetical protein DJ490_04225 [Enterobacter hormaechei]